MLNLAAATQLSESSSVRCQNKSFLRGKDDLVAVPLLKVPDRKLTSNWNGLQVKLLHCEVSEAVKFSQAIVAEAARQ